MGAQNGERGWECNPLPQASFLTLEPGGAVVLGKPETCEEDSLSG